MKFSDPANHGKFLAIMDVFKVAWEDEKGMIKEHWDVVQPIGDSKNPHPFF